MKFSPDLNYLITASDDNVIFFSKIKEYREGEDVNGFDLVSSINQGKLFNNNINISNAYSLNPLALCSKTSS